MDVDVSSYRTDPQPSALDVAGKLGGLKAQAQGIERQGIGIEHDKLTLANQRLGILSKEYSTLLADPDVMSGADGAPQKITATGQRLVNLGIIPAQMFGEFAKSVPTDPKQARQFVEQQIARAQSIQEAINYNLGQSGPIIDNNQTQQPTRWSPKTGLTAEGQPIQTQVPVTAPVIGPTGQQQMQGPTPQVAAPGAVTGPGQRLPVAPLPTQQPDISKRIVGAPGTGSSVPAPSGPATGQPVSFETNRITHAKAYEQAGERLQALKPLQSAYKLIEEFDPRTGPGTETWNKAVAFLKASNIIPAGKENDPTVVYQMLNKYLAQFVGQQGTSSDKQQAQLLEGTPDAKKQILPALKELTYKTIEFQRGLAILPYMYSSKDYGTKNYHEEYGKNINMISEKALMLDHMKDDARDALLDEMRKKRNTREGIKFEKTLEAMKNGGMNLGGQ